MRSRQGQRARFWCLVNDSMVKVSLDPGESLEWGRSEPTDEGHSFEWHKWELCGQWVYVENSEGGRDCDGPICYDSVSQCRIDKLSSREVASMPDWPLLPDWERARDTVVTDTYAQMAGY